MMVQLQGTTEGLGTVLPVAWECLLPALGLNGHVRLDQDGDRLLMGLRFRCPSRLGSNGCSGAGGGGACGLGGS